MLELENLKIIGPIDGASVLYKKNLSNYWIFSGFTKSFKGRQILEKSHGFPNYSVSFLEYDFYEYFPLDLYEILPV